MSFFNIQLTYYGEENRFHNNFGIFKFKNQDVFISILIAALSFLCKLCVNATMHFYVMT